MSEELTPQEEGAKKTCFVVIGFGKKTDYETGRVFDLDVTYKKLIEPAMKTAGVNCFRAIELDYAGSINKVMYHWLNNADIVVADISTFNANVFYELGVRYAQKRGTTILIGESGMPRIPYDINNQRIYKYEHLGEDISDAECDKFSKYAQNVLANDRSDSPVFDALQDAADEEEDEKNKPLAMIIGAAEAARSVGNYDSAAKYYQEAISLFEDAFKKAKPPSSPFDEQWIVAKPPTYLYQRLAQATYMARDPDADDEAAINALREAEQVLADNCEPEISTDPETLGLAGAIHKRLYDRRGEETHLEQSMAFYERAYHVKRDYDNGINTALLYTLKALRADSNFDAIAYHGHGNLIRQRVGDDCLKAMESKNFNSRSDNDKVVKTLALAYLGLGRTADARALMPQITNLSQQAFNWDIFLHQNSELVVALEIFIKRVNVPPDTDPPKKPEPIEPGTFTPPILGSILAVILVPFFVFGLMDTGEQGLPGRDGTDGPQGPNWLAGPAGPIGPRGDKGDDGLIGLTGNNGRDGLKGDKGDRGPIGLTGPKGDKGDPGPVVIINPELTTSFAISKTEVTFAEYDKYVKYVEGKLEETGEKPPPLDQPPFDLGWTYDEDWGRGERPVMNVNWNDVQGYIEWLNETTGITYRLPTAAEWEYAAIGAKNTNYSWGDNLDLSQINCDGCEGEKDVLDKKTAEVHSYRPNPVGLHDMHGNVWEWVDNDNNDCYVLDNYGEPVPLDPIPTDSSGNVDTDDCGLKVGGIREMRGGSYLSKPALLSGDRSNWELLTFRDCTVGFRLARDLKAGEIADPDIMVSFLQPDHAEFYNSIYNFK